MCKETYLFIGIIVFAFIASLGFVFNYKIIIVSGESMRPKYSDGQIVFLVVSDCPVDCPFGLKKNYRARL